MDVPIAMIVLLGNDLKGNYQARLEDHVRDPGVTLVQSCHALYNLLSLRGIGLPAVAA